MIPDITAVRLTPSGRRRELPLLALGPSLGTSAITLWEECAVTLTDDFDVLAWDLPGHGDNPVVPAEPFGLDELATGVQRTIDRSLSERGEPGAPFFYAGDSVGGAVGLHLLLDSPVRVRAAVLLCTGARIGSAQLWEDRIAQVRTGGTAGLVSTTPQRWFGPGFPGREPSRVDALLGALRDASDDAYVRVCAALAAYDVRDRLGEIEAPVVAVAGTEDTATPVASLREIADGVQDGRLVELTGVAHLAPAEAPDVVAALLIEHFLGGEGTP